MSAEVISGETLSFYKLFAEKGLTVEVPIIQRDYAQGRSSKSEVRDLFLEALYNYLEENEPGRDLDFVYGIISVNEGSRTFVPLDGQQRLTTLFLLHWYLAQISGNEENLRKVLTNGKRSKFTYETRSSTREFCDALLLNGFGYQSFDQDFVIAERIRDEGWYFMSWENDPSVAAMLIMLNAIEKKFHQMPQFFDRLVNQKNPIITFQFLDLTEFKLTDELYIKMNSRGKSLDSFENFKAKFSQGIDSLFQADSLSYDLKFEEGILSKSPSEYFSIQIDTSWLNHFWVLANYVPDLVDGYLMNCFRILLANHCAASNSDIPIEHIRILLKTKDAKYGSHNSENLSFHSLKGLGAISNDSVKKLIESMDTLMNIDSIEKKYLPERFHYAHDVVMARAIRHNVSSQERIRLHAFIGYLLTHPSSLEGLQEWMRVVYNLTENTRIESAEEISRGLRGVEAMLPNATDIVAHLKTTTSTYFFIRQVEEERIKAYLISRGSDWEKLIKETETNSFINGQTGFLLEFSGILEYYRIHENCDWTIDENGTYYSLFADFAKKACLTFNRGTNSGFKDYLWERTVLTKGNYLTRSSQNRRHFLITGLKERDNSWKRLLRLNPTESWYVPEYKRLLVKKVFSDPRFDANKFEDSCKAIIKDGADDWRLYFIENPELFKYCGEGFIRINSGLDIRLLQTTRLTYHYELRTLNLYLTKIKNRDFSPFQGTGYKDEYGYDGESHIFIGSWTYNRKEYALSVYHDPHNRFTVYFQKVRGDVGESNFGSQLQEICRNLKFHFKPDVWEGYCFTTGEEAVVYNTLKEFVRQVSQLK